MGNTEISSRKLEIPREHFMQRWATVKDRNGMDLTEAEDIKKKWQEYTEELYKKDIEDPDNHDDVITHLEQDILEYESSGPWEASLPIKLVEVMKFHLSYFKS